MGFSIYSQDINEFEYLRNKTSEQTKQIEELSKKNSELLIKLQRIENEIYSLSNIYKLSSENSYFGTIILIIGLLFEVFGAAFLASDSISRKILPVNSLIIKASWVDLSVENKDRGNLATFLSLIGSVFLLFGFNIQFIGTTIILGLNSIVIASVSTLAISISTTIFIFIGAQNGEQRISEKLRLFFRNLIIVFCSKPINLLSFKKVIICDLCIKPLKTDNSSILYYWEKNTENYPFLHLPSLFKIGHKKCLEHDSQYLKAITSKDLVFMSAKVSWHLKHIKEFKNSDIHILKQFLIEFKKEKKFNGSQSSQIHPSQVEFERIENLIVI